jgi:hypothetical protein
VSAARYDDPPAHAEGCADPSSPHLPPWGDREHADLEAGVDDEGLSPLQRAIGRGSEGEVRLLYQWFWADVNGNPRAEGTPLETAALHGEAGIIHFLVRCGARLCGADGRCIPMEIAQCQGHLDAMLMLAAVGAPRAVWPEDIDEDAVADFTEAWTAAHGPLTLTPVPRCW